MRMIDDDAPGDASATAAWAAEATVGDLASQTM